MPWYWPLKLRRAQFMKIVYLHTKCYRRIRHGYELDTWPIPGRPCYDCGAIKGELHVSGCDVETCPRCLGQFCGCPCTVDEGPSDEELEEVRQRAMRDAVKVREWLAVQPPIALDTLRRESRRSPRVRRAGLLTLLDSLARLHWLRGGVLGTEQRCHRRPRGGCDRRQGPGGRRVRKAAVAKLTRD